MQRCLWIYLLVPCCEATLVVDVVVGISVVCRRRQQKQRCCMVVGVANGRIVCRGYVIDHTYLSRGFLHTKIP
jgi:hypothetical protein